jgi:predicted esterase
MPFHEGSMETRIHGRYLVDVPGHGRSLLIGFHGYAETAEIQLERLRTVAPDWTLLSIQGLHRFYRGRSQDVVASWMTRQDREAAISDNKQYVASVIEMVAKEYSAGPSRVYTGFSQGVPMAFRAATSAGKTANAVIALGSDIPPELDNEALSRIEKVLLGRGERDDWYTAEKMAVDESRLRHAKVETQVFVFNAAHEWTAEFSAATARFLKS